MNPRSTRERAVEVIGRGIHAVNSSVDENSGAEDVISALEAAGLRIVDARLVEPPQREKLSVACSTLEEVHARVPRLRPSLAGAAARQGPVEVGQVWARSVDPLVGRRTVTAVTGPHVDTEYADGTRSRTTVFALRRDHVLVAEVGGAVGGGAGVAS